MEEDTLKAVWKQLWPTLLVLAVLLFGATKANADWWDWLFGDTLCFWCIDLGSEPSQNPWEN